MAKQAKSIFNPKAFLATANHGRTVSVYPKDTIVYRQAGPVGAVFYIQKGRIRITVCTGFAATSRRLLAPTSLVEGSEASIPTTQVLPIGLIVNELVTNAKKHGAEPVTVIFRAGPASQHELCVLDEGTGLPEGFTVGQPGGTCISVLFLRVVAD
jgi:hypothetical protein